MLARCSSTLRNYTINCWNCKESISLPENTALFWCPCDRKVILPPTTKDYFKILGCPQTYSQNLVKMKHGYMQLQRQLHPDKFSRRSQVELEYSSQHSALLNKAYSTLSVPYKRGLYLLELHGFPIGEDENEGANISDLQLLEDIIRMNEIVAKDPQNNVELNLLQDQTEKLLDENICMLSKYFDEGNYLEAKETLKKMKYYINIKEKIHYLLPHQ